MSVPIETLVHDLEAARRRLAYAEATRVGAEQRRGRLETEVGLAKGRLTWRSRVDAFLEDLQADAHGRRVGDFERLLTALVADVLPGENAIGLNLDIERGLPALDVVSRTLSGREEDVYEDQGGALTNVVSMGLRLIAVVRSGTRRFIILDEADCWTRNDRIPSFYHVLRQAAEKVGVQCLAISHWDISSFDDGSISIARLEGDGNVTTVENAPRGNAWSDEEEGIRWIRLRNFQPFADETLHLSPGVNAVTGRNGIGKSSIVRAFRAVFYGEGRDSLVRHGETSCSVEIGFPKGRVLCWDRQPRRNPINAWKLLEADGSIVTEGSMTYSSGGRTPPDWVGNLFGIRMIEGLDIHIARQKTPVFLLDRPGATRASVLSIGRESGHIRSMIRAHKEAVAHDQATVRDGEREMALVLSRLDRLSRIVGAEERLGTAQAIIEDIRRRSGEAATLLATIDLIEEGVRQRDMLRRRREALETVPDVEAFRSVEAALSDVRDLEMATDTMERSTKVLDRARRIAEALAPLPEEAPGIVRSDPLIQVGSAIKARSATTIHLSARLRLLDAVPERMPTLSDASLLETATAMIAETEGRLFKLQETGRTLGDERDACERQLGELIEAMGAICPVCGHTIGDPAILMREHAHGTDEADDE